MLFSESFIFTLREDPKMAECASHKLLLKGCYLSMISSGVYSYLPLGHKVLNNINNIIRKNMNSKGAQELLMSALQPIEIWQKTGRDEVLKDVMFKFKDRRDKQVCLGPTHEEAITEIVRKSVFSYKQLPFTLYQIQAKFRDEPRPRFGLMRSCEFIMKDAYSFDKDNQGLDANYEKMLDAYQNIFKECGLDIIMVKADSGAMGGSLSHEFMIPSSIGEDILFYCSECKEYFKDKGNCPKCKKTLVEAKMVEIGHIFKLGTKYSLAQNALFLDEKGKRQPFIMGCYGIGVSRVLSAIAEVNSSEKGVVWPKGIGPYEVNIVTLDKKLIAKAVGLAKELENMGIEVLVDDRNEPAGVKFNDASLIGSPYIIVMGKKYLKENKFDLEDRRLKTKESHSKEELINFFKKEYAQ